MIDENKKMLIHDDSGTRAGACALPFDGPGAGAVRTKSVCRNLYPVVFLDFNWCCYTLAIGILQKIAEKYVLPFTR